MEGFFIINQLAGNKRFSNRYSKLIHKLKDGSLVKQLKTENIIKFKKTCLI